MAFCAKCGAQLADGSFFCAVCGAPLQQQAPNQQYQQAPNQQYQQAPNQQYRQAPNQQYQQAPNQQYQQYQQAPNQQYRQAPNQQYQQGPNQQYQQYGQAPNQKSAFEQFFDTPDYTAQMHPNDIQQNKAMGILAYLGLLVLIPIFAAPQSRFARFHANQGLILDIAAMVISILAGVLTSFVPALGIIFLLIDLPVIALLILGIVNAASGKAKELPLIGKVRILN